MGNTKNTKQEAILAAAKTLFWKHGFRRVSVEEVCVKAAVSKMTFYRFFANKTELAKAVFDRVATEGVEQFRSILHDDSLLPEARLHRMMLLKYEGIHDISQEFLADFYSGREPEMRAYVDAKTVEMWQMVVNDFKEAQRKGYFRADFRPELFIILSQRLNGLANDPAALALYDSPQDMLMELTNLLIYGIAPHK